MFLNPYGKVHKLHGEVRDLLVACHNSVGIGFSVNFARVEATKRHGSQTRDDKVCGSSDGVQTQW